MKRYDELKELGEKVEMAQELAMKETATNETLVNLKELIERAKIKHSNDEKMLTALEEASAIIELFHADPPDMESIRERVEKLQFC